MSRPRLSNAEICKKWHALPEALRQPFPELEFRGKEFDLSTLDDDQLREARAATRWLVKPFKRRQVSREIWCLLMEGNSGAAAALIQKYYIHLRIRAPFHIHAHAVRRNDDIMKLLHPVLCELSRIGIRHIDRYRQLNDLEAFRAGFVLLIPAARIAPSLIPSIDARLARFSDSLNSEFVPSLLRESLRAEGYDELPSDADWRFVSVWNGPLEGQRGEALNCHIPGYEANHANVGWKIIISHTRDALPLIRQQADLHLRTVILSTHQKCHDPDANEGRIALRFWKMHRGLHAIARHPYGQLSLDLNWRVQEIIGGVRRSSKQSLRRQPNLINTLNAIEAELRRRRPAEMRKLYVWNTPKVRFLSLSVMIVYICFTATSPSVPTPALPLSRGRSLGNN